MCCGGECVVGVSKSFVGVSECVVGVSVLWG